MGTVHKFKRPPKNQQQFKGYQPLGGVGGIGKRPRRLAFRAKLRPWHRSVLAWTLLIAAAAVIVGVRRLLHL